jgi:hypothetical protein
MSLTSQACGRPLDPEDCLTLTPRFPIPVELRLSELAQSDPAAFVAALSDSIGAAPCESPETLDTIQGLSFALEILARAVADGRFESLRQAIAKWNRQA